MIDESEDDRGEASGMSDASLLASVYRPEDASTVDQIPLEVSVGYQVRSTHRALQRYLRSKIEPHGVTLGMWYFLRVLWQQDGLTQRELSRRIGTMEPTTLNAIASMERIGLVHRVRDHKDRRRQFVFLTEKGRALSHDLLPLAGEVIRDASSGLTLRELTILLSLLSAIQANLTQAQQAGADTDDDP